MMDNYLKFYAFEPGLTTLYFYVKLKNFKKFIYLMRICYFLLN